MKENASLFPNACHNHFCHFIASEHPLVEGRRENNSYNCMASNLNVGKGGGDLECVQIFLDSPYYSII